MSNKNNCVSQEVFKEVEWQVLIPQAERWRLKSQEFLFQDLKFRLWLYVDYFSQKSIIAQFDIQEPLASSSSVRIIQWQVGIKYDDENDFEWNEVQAIPLLGENPSWRLVDKWKILDQSKFENDKEAANKPLIFIIRLSEGPLETSSEPFYADRVFKEEVFDEEWSTLKKRKRVELPESEDLSNEEMCILPSSPQVPINRHERDSGGTTNSYSENIYNTAENCNQITSYEEVANVPRSDQPTSTEKRLIRMLSQVIATQKEHSRLLNKILCSDSNFDPLSADKEFSAQLPVKSLEDFCAFETSIKDESVFSRAIKYLSNRGGVEVKKVTRTVLECLMEDGVAAHFNWAGRGEKHDFKNLKTRSLILYAVRQNMFTKDAAASDVEEVIKQWLKYAPVRLKYRSQKKECVIVT